MSGSVITTYHLRGMTDSGGSPDATIDTIKVYLLSNGNIRFEVSKDYTRADDGGGGSGVTKTYQYEVSDATAKRLIYDALNLTFLMA